MRSKENEEDANLDDHLEGIEVRSQGAQGSLGTLAVPDQGRFHSPAQGYDQHNEEAKGYEYSWLEYRHDPHTDRVHMNVDKLRDEAENFAHLVTLWHGVVIDY